MPKDERDGSSPLPGEGGPNGEQIRSWNGGIGEAWLRRYEALDRQLGALGELAMEATPILAGHRVLDVGCGQGTTTLELGRRVGPEGLARGIDVSVPLLRCARARAAQGGVKQATFLLADPQTTDLGEAAFDVVYSRFGVMFFSEPIVAFQNLCRSLLPGGRLSFVCWQAVEKNPWMLLPLAAVARHLTLPPRPDPGTPGPFAFADGERVRRILEEAGFDQIRVDDWKGALSPGGGGLQESIELFFEIGPLSSVLREMDAGPEVRVRLEETLREVLTPYDSPAGLWMPAASWIVTAARP
jgi:SAM-dependent methyltransferase